MPADEPITWLDGIPIPEGDLNTLRNLLRWLAGFEPGVGSKPFARIRSSVDVALPDSPDWNLLTFDTVVFDEGEATMFTAGSLTVPVAGFYLVGACCRTAPTTANKALRIRRNDDVIVEQDNIGISTPAYTEMNVSTLYMFSAADVISADVYQDSGGTINAVVDGLASPVLWAAWYAVWPGAPA